jgi:hypothetical protein
MDGEVESRPEMLLQLPTEAWQLRMVMLMHEAGERSLIPIRLRQPTMVWRSPMAQHEHVETAWQPA